MKITRFAGQAWYEEMIADADESAYQRAVAEGKADNNEWELLQEEALLGAMAFDEGWVPEIPDRYISEVEMFNQTLRATGWLPESERYPGWQMPVGA